MWARLLLERVQLERINPFEKADYRNAGGCEGAPAKEETRGKMDRRRLRSYAGEATKAQR